MGTDYGSVLTFVTTGLHVRTDDATVIGYKNATLNGTLIYDADEVCEVRFEYGQTVSYGLTTAWQPGMVTGDTFNAIIRGLASTTAIHFRAAVRNPHGYHYGEDKVFTTLNADRHPSTAFDPSLQLLWA